ncbi:vWA domain-containing protein [Bergeyella sp. RCAD1439]|uniref:vWA domain-containing protein n=1 Tax=Bergeyella anatis TaxID=3113737 RepID=UPI002E19CA1D|nr:VWA domain-containing protein [Bergeyella sp. RCAD1439]
MEWTLGNYWYLLLLLLLPILGVILFRFVRWREERKDRFADRAFQSRLFAGGSVFSKGFPVFYLLAFLFLVLSVVDLLRGAQEVESQRRTGSVIFLLDVSNSMNAEDVEPSRLELAKHTVVQVLHSLVGERVGLIVFAGEARSVMPLTTDFKAAETYISGVETSVVQIQGTDFLAAMEEAVRKFKHVPKGVRQVVLISDGEDNEGNDEAALKLAEKEGIRVLSVGIGKEEGAPVPEYGYGQLLGYKADRSGQTVLTKRESGALVSLASKTGGQYVDGNDLESSVSQLVKQINGFESGGMVKVFSRNAKHYYQYFLAVSLLFFFLIYLFNPKRDLNI